MHPATDARVPAGARVLAARPTRDALRTKASILAAATHEFARHGLSGARVDRIAERAKTNKRMLYYYFGRKEALFLAVLERAYENIRAEEQKLRLLELPPARGVEQLVVFTWNYFLAHPEFMSLLNTENLHRARHLKKSKKVLAMHSPLLATLGELLKRGAREGVFRRGVDPVQLYVSIAALGYFYISNNHTLSTIFGRDLLTAAAKEARIAHAVEFTLGYLTGK
jgi:AcrR family transcriptional regulator